MGGAFELWGIGTLDSTSTGFVGSWTIDEVFRLNDPAALGESVEVIVRGIVTRRDISAITIATQLFHGFHTSRTFIYHLYKVEVTISNDGKTDT